MRFRILILVSLLTLSAMNLAKAQMHTAAEPAEDPELYKALSDPGLTEPKENTDLFLALESKLNHLPGITTLKTPMLFTFEKNSSDEITFDGNETVVKLNPAPWCVKNTLHVQGSIVSLPGGAKKYQLHLVKMAASPPSQCI